jgi:polysaccharide pyruvyl transferase CsaB
MTTTERRRVVLYSPDRGRRYDGTSRDQAGVGGGITARLSLVEALAALGHDVTAVVNCGDAVTEAGVRYLPLDAVDRIDADVLIAISTGGDLSFAPLRRVTVTASLRLLWVQGAPKPDAIDVVAPDRIVAASNFLRDVCTQRWAMPADRMAVIYNGLHQSSFRIVEAAPPARDPFAVAYIGPREKGLDAAISVVQRLRATDDRFHLDVFGGDRLWGRESDGVPEAAGVRFMGLLGQRDLARTLHAYEYCLALQTMTEGFGIAVQEARRAGAIVVASPAGALKEMVRSGFDGFLISGSHHAAATQVAAARLMLSLAVDPPRRARIRHRARQVPWDWHTAAHAWSEYWSMLLDSTATGTSTGDAVVALSDGLHRLSDGAYFPTIWPASPLDERLGAPAPRQVVVAGYIGHGNLGDEAILGSVLTELQTAAPHVMPVVVSGEPHETAALHDVTAIDERDLTALDRAVAASDLVVLGGGGLFHDHFGVDEATRLTARHWGLASCATIADLATRHDVPLVVLAAGVGPLTSDAGRRLTREICAGAAGVSVRDAESFDTLVSLDLSPAAICRAADPALLLAPSQNGSVPMRAHPDASGTSPLVAVALRDWDLDASHADWPGAVAGALDRLIETHAATILFVPFSQQQGADGADDVATAARVHRTMRHHDRARIHDDPLTPAAAHDLLAQSQAVLAMRLHAALLAVTAGVPVVALSYDPKVRSTMAALGLEDATIDLRAVTADRLHARLSAALDSGTAMTSVVEERLPALRAAARAPFMDIGGILARRVHDARPVPSTASPRATPAPAPHPITRAPAPSTIGRRLARAILPAPLRRAIRDTWRRRLMSPQAYVFHRFRQARSRMYGVDLSRLRAPGVPGRVTVVLPVYNGAAFLREAIDGILAQTHADLELVVVNDGSTDDSGGIADAAAALDSRVRVIHQANAQLPAALSRGIAEATGEFVTWTSADNRMLPECLALLLDSLRRHPDWDMAYGNLRLIDETGRVSTGSREYESYQHPRGSGFVRLPAHVLDLNVRPNNYVGAALLYRRRVAALLGDYDRRRFVVEDYDYWMRVNALMTLRHAATEAPLVDYRFHGDSLTSQWDALGMTTRRDRLMVHDDFRRDFYLAPMLWRVEGAPRLLVDRLTARLAEGGHRLADPMPVSDGPNPWLPVVSLGVVDLATASVEAIAPDLHSDAICRVLISDGPAPALAPEGWDLRLALMSSDASTGIVPDDWLTAPDLDTLLHAIDIRVRTICVNAVAAVAEDEETASPPVRASVIISTIQPDATFDAAITAVLSQASAEPFELIVVLNGPPDEALARRLTTLDARIRVIACPWPGISAARNAAIGAARGDFVLFLDDDAIAGRDWLDRMCRAFDAHPAVGVIGGPVRLQLPTPRPLVVARGWESYWSDFVPPSETFTIARETREFPWGANWAARRRVLAAIGGFRLALGRVGRDAGGGEELLAAAHAQQLGYEVGIEPRAAVTHRVRPDRFTYAHVRQTMVARHLAAHAVSRALARGGGPGAIARSVARIALHHADPRLRSWRHLGREIQYRKSAQARVLIAQWQDLRARRGRPAEDEI